MEKIIYFLIALFFASPAYAQDIIREYDSLTISGWRENEFALKGEPEQETEMAIAQIQCLVAENPGLKLVLLIEGCASTTGIHPVNDHFGDVRAEQVASKLRYAFPDAVINPISRGQSREDRKVIVTPKFASDKIVDLTQAADRLSGKIDELDKKLASVDLPADKAPAPAAPTGLRVVRDFPWYWWLFAVIILAAAVIGALVSFMNGRKIKSVSNEIARYNQSLKNVSEEFNRQGKSFVVISDEINKQNQSISDGFANQSQSIGAVSEKALKQIQHLEVISGAIVKQNLAVKSLSEEVAKQGQAISRIEQQTDPQQTSPFEIEGVRYRYLPEVEEETGMLISPYKGLKFKSIQEVRRSAIAALRKDHGLRDKELAEGRLIRV
jgi:hypothetical protein